MTKYDFIELEELKATFFDEDALIEQPKPVFRINSGGLRYYYDFDEEGELTFYTSITSVIKQTLPTSEHLIKWIADKGYDESKEYAAIRAEYGTFLHIQIGDFLINQFYDLDKLKERLKDYIDENKLPASCIDWEEELKKDMLAFVKFCIDYEVKPLAVELVLTNPMDGVAGAIDLICEMTIQVEGFYGEVYKSGPRKGEPKATKQPKRIRAVVDFKSGRKGFYEEHEIQLEGYRRMWEFNFPEFPIEKLFNWSPKDWRGKEPTYNLKDQSESKNLKKYPNLIELASIEYEKKSFEVNIFQGVIEPKRGLESNIINLSLGELIKRARSEKEKGETPEEELGISEAMEAEHQKRFKDQEFDTKDDLSAEGYEGEV